MSVQFRERAEATDGSDQENRKRNSSRWSTKKCITAWRRYSRRRNFVIEQHQQRAAGRIVTACICFFHTNRATEADVTCVNLTSCYQGSTGSIIWHQGSLGRSSVIGKSSDQILIGRPISAKSGYPAASFEPRIEPTSDHQVRRRARLTVSSFRSTGHSSASSYTHASCLSSSCARPPAPSRRARSRTLPRPPMSPSPRRKSSGRTTSRSSPSASGR